MSNWKRFLIGYAVIYMIVATGMNVVLGPPGMSKEYLSQYKSDYDRYIDIQKSDEYKLWVERPELHEPNASLQADIDFAEKVEANTDFQDEEKRRYRYDLLFDFFNAGMLIYLIVHFSRKPIAGLLDGMIGQIETALNKAETALTQSNEELANAENKLGNLAKEEADLETQTQKRIKKAEEENRILNGQTLSVMNRETMDRMKYEEVLARQALKRELVEKVINESILQAKSGAGLIEQEALLNQFIQQLEKPE
jgi:F0F1-type ATP synthase membrane subunit b/b'